MSKKLSKLPKVFIIILLISCNNTKQNDILKIVFSYNIDSANINNGSGIFIEFEPNPAISSIIDTSKQYYWYWFFEHPDSNIFLYINDTIINGCIVKDTSQNFDKSQLFLSFKKLFSLQKARDKYEKLFLNEFKMIIKLNENDSLIYYKNDRCLIEYRLDGVVISVDDSVKMNRQIYYVLPPTSPDDTIF